MSGKPGISRRGNRAPTVTGPSGTSQWTSCECATHADVPSVVELRPLGREPEEPHGADGHDSVRAVLIYQHRTAEAGRKIADAMNGKIEEALPDDQQNEFTPTL
ncbi:hypothetical protein GCM10010126_23720 [Planomonospora parontospora]|uniref:Uncharacterized protein n=1 Tax=Planomonospora parontospora TaxID=58119 RepID=A0AA37BF98_9ACTN|nr:hypothetical protein GCM10010126_23720 [Planomonospora parontospora]